MRRGGHSRPGRLETLAANTIIMAVGQDADTAFLRQVPGVEFQRDGSVVVSQAMMTGCPGVFAGGDMVPDERTVTVGVGHGKKAARFVDAYLSGEPGRGRPEERGGQPGPAQRVDHRRRRLGLRHRLRRARSRAGQRSRRQRACDGHRGVLQHRGQASKSTPPGAVAKFAAAGKAVPKKDLALQAIAYGNVYVARVAMGADPQQTLRALREAESYRGTSLVLAYSHCIAHGIEKDGMPLRNGMDQQYRAVATGYWPLVRYDPVLRDAGRNPFLLDSHRPRLPLSDYTGRELRYRILARTNPEAAERLSKLAEQQVSQRWATYEEMAARSPEWFPASGDGVPASTENEGSSR